MSWPLAQGLLGQGEGLPGEPLFKPVSLQRWQPRGLLPPSAAQAGVQALGCTGDQSRRKVSSGSPGQAGRERQPENLLNSVTQPCLLLGLGLLNQWAL